jgi:hypothetical protein
VTRYARAMLDGGKARCAQLRDDMKFYTGSFELSELADAEVELVRRATGDTPC